MLQQGACVVLADIDQESLESAVASLSESFGCDVVRGVICDVTEEASVTAAVDFWASVGGRSPPGTPAPSSASSRPSAPSAPRRTSRTGNGCRRGGSRRRGGGAASSPSSRSRACRCGCSGR